MSPLGRSGKHYMNPKVMEAHGDAPDAVPPIPEDDNQQMSQPEMIQCPSCGAEFPAPDKAEEQAEEQVAPGIHEAAAKNMSAKMASSDNGAY